MTMPGGDPTGGADAPLLEVEGLVKHFAVRGPTLFSGERGRVHAVNGVSFTLDRGETLALVGESGCGKTTCARTVAQLYRPDAGTVRFKGEDLGRLSRRRLKAVRRSIALVFQDPFGSLNPRLPVGAIVAEPLKIHGQGDRAWRLARMAEVLDSRPLSNVELLVGRSLGLVFMAWVPALVAMSLIQVFGGLALAFDWWLGEPIEPYSLIGFVVLDALTAFAIWCSLIVLLAVLQGREKPQPRRV